MAWPPLISPRGERRVHISGDARIGMIDEVMSEGLPVSAPTAVEPYGKLATT